MNLNNIATIGHNGIIEPRNPISLYQNDYLMPYDCIIASTNAILAEIKATNHDANGDYHAMTDQLEKRRADLKEFYNMGGTVILIIDTLPTYNYHDWLSGDKLVNAMDILSTEELPFTYSPQNGKGVTIAPNLSTLLSQAQISFNTLLQGEPTQALITTQKTQTPLSYHQKIGNGLFIALPCVTLNEGADQETFTQGLLNVCEELKQQINIEV
jgi:hypothetical protein